MAQVSHALCDEHSLNQIEKARVADLRVTSFGGVSPDGLLQQAANEPAAEPYAAVNTAADDVALITFTCGTTGRPKGCELPAQDTSGRCSSPPVAGSRTLYLRS